MDKVRDKLEEALDFLTNKESKVTSSQRIENARISIEEALAADNWQPIETAPKDGKALYGHWTNLDEWSQTIFHYYAEPIALGYTHWQPLPNPPEKIGE